MRKLGVILFAMLAFSCCNTEEKKVEVSTFRKFFNNGEIAGSWINTNTIKEGPAFSGKYSSQVDSVTEFGLGFKDVISSIGDGIPTKIVINAMVMRPSDIDDATLVISVDRDKNVFWQGAGIKAIAVKPGEWTKLNLKYNLPKDLQATDKISVYLWSDKKKKAYMDDFEVSFE